MLAGPDEEWQTMEQHTSIPRFLAGRLGAYALAVAVAYLLATVGATWYVIASLDGMGVSVPLSTRLAMTTRDLAGMAGMFLPMVAMALLVALLTAALLSRWLARWRLPLYLLAGAVALVAIHVALKQAFGLTPVPIARSAAGLVQQALSGAVAAGLYLWTLRRQSGRARAGGKRS